MTDPSLQVFAALNNGHVIKLTINLIKETAEREDVKNFAGPLTHMVMLNYRRACVLTTNLVLHVFDFWNKSVSFSVSMSTLFPKVEFVPN